MLALALWAWLGTLQWGPDLPPLGIQYLHQERGARGLDGMSEVAPAQATMILFKGGFAFGATAAMRAALDQAPDAKTVAFESPGGRIGAAAGVAGLIRDRHLATAVMRYCASACTIAYVAGQPRLSSQAAIFRFHLGSAPFLADLAARGAVMIARPWFVRAGVSLAFVDRALHAPNDRPYGPRLDELAAAGYVQRIEPPPAGDGPAAGLEVLQPLLAAVEALEPTTRRALGWEHANRIANGMTAAQSADFVEMWAGLVVNRWLARSSDDAAVALVDAMTAIMDAMGAAEPTGCMRWQVGVFSQMAGFRAIPADLRGRLRQAQVMVLHDARAHSNTVPSDGDALVRADQAVRQTVTAQYGAQALATAATPEHAFDDPARSCAAEAAYLRGLRNQPAGGRLLRWALAAG